MGAQLLVGTRALAHDRVRQLLDGGRRRPDPHRLRRREVGSPEGPEAKVRPGQLLPPEPEHPALVGGMDARRARADDLRVSEIGGRGLRRGSSGGTGVRKQTAPKTSGPAVGLYRPSFRALRAARKTEVPDPSRAFKTLVALKKR